MSSWPRRPLATQARRVQQRVDPTTLPPTPYVGLEHIGVGTLSLVRRASSEHVASPCFAFAQGDILFGALRPAFRKVVRAPWDGVCSTEAWVLRPLGGTDRDFLFYVLANPDFVALCARSAEGTRMPRARWDYVASVPLPWPPPPEQRRIASVLALLDARIALGRRSNQTVQALLRALFEAHVVAPAASDPRWTPGRLGDVATCHRETVDPASLPSDTPCVGLADMTRGSLALESWGQAGDARSAKHRFRAGDLLFGRLRPGFKKVVVAPVDGVCSPDVLVLRPRQPTWTAPLLGWLTEDAFIDHACAVATGTRMPRAGWRALAAWPVALPPADALPRLHRAAEPLLARLLLDLAQARTLAQARDTLLPGLLSGAIRPHGQGCGG